MPRVRQRPCALVGAADGGAGFGVGAFVGQFEVVAKGFAFVPGAEAVAADVRAAGRRALLVQADVGDDAQVVAMFQQVDRELGTLQGLVNNAGVVDVAARVDEMSVARWKRMFDINVIGSLIGTRLALKHGAGFVRHVFIFVVLALICKTGYDTWLR